MNFENTPSSQLRGHENRNASILEYCGVSRSQGGYAGDLIYVYERYAAVRTS